MTFYLVFVVINLFLVLADCIYDYFKEDELVMTRSLICIYSLIIMAGFTGTILLAAFAASKVPPLDTWLDKEVTIISKDTMWDNFGKGGMF